jgi:ribosomal protein L11 methylase PrmA
LNAADTRLRLTFSLPDAAADWAGAALPDLFPDGLLLQPSSGGVTRLQGWLPAGQARREAEARRRLGLLGAARVSARLVTPQAPKALHGRFPTLRLGRFVIQPAAQAKPARLRPAEKPIILIQGQAFGTGLHESTRLMLGQIERLAKAWAPGLRALDVGAGSGILGFACLHLGAAQVACVEVERAACAELRGNRALNGVKPAAMPVICGRFPLARLRGRRYPLVLGNLVTPVLGALMPRLAAQVERGGTLLCSGIHTPPEAALVKAAARRQGLRLRGQAVLRDWNVLRFDRPGRRP